MTRRRPSQLGLPLDPGAPDRYDGPLTGKQGKLFAPPAQTRVPSTYTPERDEIEQRIAKQYDPNATPLLPFNLED